MSEGYTIKEVYDIVQNTTLSDALEDILNWDLIEDSDLRQLWQNARDALIQLQDFLGDWDSMRVPVEDDGDNA
jgi:hypothetical protein